mmetsp:Transcript_85154/g.260212  ORF Transcript_85154/g.260212 Transcript_85154/m.260212 type:complete len:232 (-) Transcript_85154:3167-3862(-)
MPRSGSKSVSMGKARICGGASRGGWGRASQTGVASRGGWGCASATGVAGCAGTPMRPASGSATKLAVHRAGGSGISSSDGRASKMFSSDLWANTAGWGAALILAALGETPGGSCGMRVASATSVVTRRPAGEASALPSRRMVLSPGSSHMTASLTTMRTHKSNADTQSGITRAQHSAVHSGNSTKNWRSLPMKTETLKWNIHANEGRNKHCKQMAARSCRKAVWAYSKACS